VVAFLRIGGSTKRTNIDEKSSDQQDNTLKSQKNRVESEEYECSQSSPDDQLMHSMPSFSQRSYESHLISQISSGSAASELGSSKHSSIYRCISTEKGYRGYAISVTIAGDFLYNESVGNNILQLLPGHPGLLEYFKFSHGECVIKSLLVTRNKIFSAHQDHKIRVWQRSPTNPTVHKLVSVMPTLKDRLINMMSSTNYVEVRRHKRSLWIQHVDTISNLAVDTKNGYLYSASWDRTVKVWRISDFCCIESFRAHDDAINALLLSAGEALYTASADSMIKVWAKSSCGRKHCLVTTLHSHKSAVNALALSADGLILYSGACDRSVIAWKRDITQSAEHIEVAGILRGHKRAILCLASISDLLCSGSADTTIRVWKKGLGLESNTIAHSCLLVLEGHCRPVKSITASNLGMEYLVYSGSLDHDVKVWRFCDTPNPKPI
jgi:WD40 repeat protein